MVDLLATRLEVMKELASRLLTFEFEEDEGLFWCGGGDDEADALDGWWGAWLKGKWLREGEEAAEGCDPLESVRGREDEPGGLDVCCWKGEEPFEGGCCCWREGWGCWGPPLKSFVEVVEPALLPRLAIAWAWACWSLDCLETDLGGRVYGFELFVRSRDVRGAEEAEEEGAAGMKLKGFSSSSYELEEDRVLCPGFEEEEGFWLWEGDWRVEKEEGWLLLLLLLIGFGFSRIGVGSRTWKEEDSQIESESALTGSEKWLPKGIQSFTSSGSENSGYRLSSSV
jgi:hypothetical protein